MPQLVDNAPSIQQCLNYQAMPHLPGNAPTVRQGPRLSGQAQQLGLAPAPFQTLTLASTLAPALTLALALALALALSLTLLSYYPIIIAQCALALFI